MSTRPESEDPPTTPGQAIRREREARGWTQAYLARMLETGEKNVRNWETGKNQPSQAFWRRVCLLFGWPLPYSDPGVKGPYPHAAALAMA